MRKLDRAAIGSFLGLGLVLAGAHFGAGCSATQGTGGAFGDGGGGHEGHSTGSEAQGGFSSGGGFNPSGPGSTGSGIDPDAACATSTAQASLVPVNMYIMFDDSGSMADNNKWNDASAALESFFADPGSAGLRVALRFFPDGACSNTQCDASACATPAVQLGALTADPAPVDSQEQFLIDVTNAHGPASGGGTPMYAAVDGAEQFATTYLAAHPTEKSVVILVTDGEPNGCDQDIGDIAGLAASAFTEGVLTFAVGLQGSNEAQMNQIATAGGTNAAVLIGSGTNAEQDLLMALQAIRGMSVSCQFTMPATDDNGDPIDPTKVNVDYTPGGMGNSITFPEVMGAAQCGNMDGWYYDDPAHPTTITLCPHSCQDVQGDQEAKIQMIVGCASQIPH